MLDIVKFLLEQGIALISSRKAKRQHFFNQVVEPIHLNYRSMAAHHESTLQYVVRELRKPAAVSSNIYEEVRTRNANEEKEWLLIEKLSDRADIIDDSYRDLFNAYFRVLYECICPQSRKLTIQFYDSAERALLSEHWDVDGGKSREEIIERIKGIQSDFAHYCSRVEIEYIVIRKASLG